MSKPKSKPPTEAQLRDSEAPRCKTIKELTAYITSLVKRDHDYGTCVYAMSLSATAAFNYVASQLGVTGFQASCADLDVLRRTRGITGPFMIINAENMLYPQYDLHTQLEKAMQGWREWAADEAKKKLAEDNKYTHADVITHWKKLAAYVPNEQPK